jgi:hypothetical protein
MAARLRPTLDDLIALDPRIGLLLHEAATPRDDGSARSFCADEAFLGRFKPRIAQLVGWWRRDRDEVLSTSAAYDAVFDAVYDLMPPCRRCACL